jgi:hypothetical protein
MYASVYNFRACICEFDFAYSRAIFARLTISYTTLALVRDLWALFVIDGGDSEWRQHFF